MKKLIATNDNITLTILRVVLGIIMFAHGAQKLLGWYGGFGFEGTMGYFTGSVGIPYILGVLVIIIEFFGGLLLIAGAFTRVWAAGSAAVIMGAVFTVHLQNGFFMNFSGQKAGEGYEYHLLIIAVAVVLMISGAGAASVDRYLSQKRES